MANEDYSLWHYNPSIPGAVVFLVLFGLVTLTHCWKLFHGRVWFGIPFVVGGVFEVVGYIGRILSHDVNGWRSQMGPYIIQSTFILLAPIFFAASLYMTLGRLINALDAPRSCTFISPRWLTRIFVIADVLSLCIQSSGAGFLADPKASESKRKLGQTIVIVGLVVPCVIFALFAAVAGWFQMRYSVYRATAPALADGAIPWRKILTMLYGTSALVMVRNIFRIVEYVMGVDGYLMATEWPVFAFDGALMFLVMAWFLLPYPDVLPVRKTSRVEKVDVESRDQSPGMQPVMSY